MIKFKTALIAAAALAFAAPAFAQDNGSITLQVNSGSVMTSNGGEFVTAASGTQLAPGQKLMVQAGSSATARYANGCSMQFTAPGTYSVPAVCAGMTSTSGGSHVKDVLIFAGASAAAMAAIASKGTTPAPRYYGVSAGWR